MTKIILIGISAGAATALLFASLASGSLVSIPLFYLAPLPVLIAGLGWSHWAALIAALFGTASLALVFNNFLFVAFLIGVGLPAWWLSYLALLARPAQGPKADGMEWYPVGRLVLWAAVLAAIVVAAAIPLLGIDEDSFRTNLRSYFEGVFRILMQTPEGASLEIPGVSDPSRLLDFLVVVIPLASAVSGTLVNVVNLWLAARVVKVSGRLQRPWPELPALTFPPLTPALLAAAVAGAFLPGVVAILSGILAASLTMAYAVLGFAVLHVITRGIDGRPIVLTLVYAIVLIFQWPVLIMSLLGLADTSFDLRRRATRKRGPPTLPQ
jgi:hypothetical protein